jgi:hypothetical protein
MFSLNLSDLALDIKLDIFQFWSFNDKMFTVYDDWCIGEGLLSLFWLAFFVFTCLAILSFPNRFRRWTAVMMLIVPACGAFETGDQISPDLSLNDIYLRFVVILFSHVVFLSFEDTLEDRVSNALITVAIITERRK